MPCSQTPYVVTDDLDLVFGMLSRSGIAPPSSSRMKLASGKVIASLRRIFPKVDTIEAERISGFLRDCVQKSTLPVVSLTSLLDEPTAQSSLMFSRSMTTAGVNNGKAALADIGLMPRYEGGRGLQQQFMDVAQKIKRIDSSAEIALADDVVFSGGTVKKIIDGLRNEGISVRRVFASVALQGAIDHLKSENINVTADYTYTSVLDEVCMRDFVVAAPGGGRNVILPDGRYASAPYLRPFGQIEKWASIEGADASQYSKSCLEASAEVWDGLTNAKQKVATFSDLEKPILFCDSSEEISFKLREYLREKSYDTSFTNAL